MLNDFISVQNVQITDRVKDWRQAVARSVRPLRDFDYVDETYEKAILRNVETYGSTFIVCPYIILPHARPEEGVIKNGVSILLVHKPFYLHEQSIPIKLMIVLSPKNARVHLQMLRDISLVLHDERQLKCILNSKTAELLFAHFTAEQKG